MAPIVLKVKGNMQSLPFGNLDSSDDLSKTWRVCTKVKDSLENGSRLENLSWRLWFAHNVNDSHNNKKSVNVTATKTSLTNFRIPDNFDFKAKNNRIEKKSDYKEFNEANYKRQLCLQQKKQADSIAQKMAITTTNNKKKQVKVTEQQEFTLHQYTSDQAGDQVIELDDIFKSLGGNMQAYLNPSEEQQLDTLINEAWPISGSSSSSIHDTYANVNDASQSPIKHSFPSTPYNYNNYNSHHHDIQGSALYVSSEAMPPIPLGTLHNKLLNTLPKETLESAGRLLSAEEMVDLQSQPYPHHHQQQSQTSTHAYHQSTPNTPYVSPNASFHMNTPSVMNSQPPMNDTYRFFLPPQQAQPKHTTTPYTFSHHHHPPAPPPPPFQHSKSLPPSRAASPPPYDVASSNSSTSSSPISPSTSTRRTAPINSSPSEGKAPICSNCSTASTPLWRRSANDELLCNACGLYLKLHNAPRPKYLKPQSSRKDAKGEDENIIQPLCSNCGTSTTPLWRRDLDGSSLCNACGLYLKLHHEKRPLSMKTDNIKKRQRCENVKTQPSQPNTIKKKNRMVEEPLTTTFDSTCMEDVDQPYSPFGTFGLTLTNQPI